MNPEENFSKNQFQNPQGFSENQNQQFQNIPGNRDYYFLGQVPPQQGPIFQGPTPPNPRDNNGRAVAALVLGILSWLPGIGLILAPIGIALGITGMKSEKRGLAMTGLILSGMGFFISLIVPAIVLVNLNIARVKAKKANMEHYRVIGGMNQIRPAAEFYRSQSLSQSYEGFEKSQDFLRIKEDIKNYAGVEPVVYTKSDAYCAEIKLPNEKWYCVDYIGAKEFYNDPPCSYDHFSCE